MTKDAKILSVQRRWRPSVPRMTAWIVLLGAMLAVAGCGGDSGGGDWFAGGGFDFGTSGGGNLLCD